MIATKTEQREAKGKVLVFGFLVAVLMAACLLLTARLAQAATFTVNSTGDSGDNNPGNGSCDTGVRVPGPGVGLVPECTLRAAIQETNANDNDATVVDAIHFNIGGSGVKTIQPTSGLPDLTEAVTIDGYTQPGSKPNTLASGNNAAPKIELDGTNAGSASGLGLATDGNVIRGLVINRFVAYGLGISTGSTENKIEGNFIGTDATGTLDLGNGISGVTIFDAPNNTVGGTAPAARNVISGNENFGVYIGGDDNKVMGNYIGTNRNGTADLGNTVDGVGILGGASGNTVGGATGARNTIAFNSSSGVTVFSGVRNRILSNSIYANDALGIDLGGDGITPNDAGDPDVGPNNLQNFPLITSAKTGRRATTIKSTIDSTSNATFTIQFFSNPKGTRDEGKKFIGQTTVTDTDSDGIIIFPFKPPKKVKPGLFVTATATDDATGDTSELSAPKKVRG